jgi:hypothetical protein
MQVDVDLMIKTDEPAQVEWAVIVSSKVLANSSRAEFDALVTSGDLPFQTSEARCHSELPSNRKVRFAGAVD